VAFFTEFGFYFNPTACLRRAVAANEVGVDQSVMVVVMQRAMTL
jgi:hypothetical protein